ncbi:hypothetical protein [Flavobacterium algicola]|uniref:hypothetical protein n=1 Tax=Flavobacterium algicola TaxID=556529 RepID=UPI001EFD324A|nr:hypothetical protein [Flavobacterium algicola]MCG9792505.1 hypothetical protein [Flavobacterium algicola]
MSPEEKLTELLTGKSFTHQGEQFNFVNCKRVVSNIMIFTNKKLLQIPVDRFVDFFQKVESNCEDVVSTLVEKKEYIPTAPYTAEVASPQSYSSHRPVKVMAEMPKVFEKLNESFEDLINKINTASEGDLKSLEIRAKMLTSVAQTSINMENSRINLIKMLNR